MSRKCHPIYFSSRVSAPRRRLVFLAPSTPPKWQNATPRRALLCHCFPAHNGCPTASVAPARAPLKKVGCAVSDYGRRIASADTRRECELALRALFPAYTLFRFLSLSWFLVLCSVCLWLVFVLF